METVAGRVCGHKHQELAAQNLSTIFWKCVEHWANSWCWATRNRNKEVTEENVSSF